MSIPALASIVMQLCSSCWRPAASSQTVNLAKPCKNLAIPGASLRDFLSVLKYKIFKIRRVKNHMMIGQIFHAVSTHLYHINITID